MPTDPPHSGGSSGGGGTVEQGTMPWVTDPGVVTVNGTVIATGPLTNAELRASGILVTGPLTDTQLRAAALPISAALLPLPAGAAKDATLTDGTQRVGGTLDVSDRAARLVGVVSGTVGVSNFPATRIIAGTGAGAASSMYVSAIGRRIS